MSLKKVWFPENSKLSWDFLAAFWSFLKAGNDVTKEVGRIDVLNDKVLDNK